MACDVCRGLITIQRDRTVRVYKAAFQQGVELTSLQLDQTMAILFSVPITSTGGTIVCTKHGEEKENIYVLTFTSPKDNRLTPTFIDAFILALDIIEHRYPKGVVVTTSGIPKFYSNGLDLDLATSTEGFLDKWLWRLFRRFLTYVFQDRECMAEYERGQPLTSYFRYPMPTVCLLNGHAFAGGFMLAMYHDYRIQNPNKGFLCVNELEFGVPLQTPMMSIFREKLVPTTFRSVVLEAHRFGGPASLKAGIVDAVGGLDEVVGLIRDRKLLNKAATGIYGTMKEEMYARVLNGLDDHVGNLAWREKVEDRNEELRAEGLKEVEKWEKSCKAKL
jgi:enoyl-CoA hydratase/carnithine racemase